jgi:hypothetical protein
VRRKIYQAAQADTERSHLCTRHGGGRDSGPSNLKGESMFKITGHVEHVGDVKIKGAKGNFKIRDVVLTEDADEGWPNLMRFTAKQDNCSLLDELKTGEQVEIEFKLNGRDWTNPQGERVFFTDNEVIGITSLDLEAARDFDAEPPELPSSMVDDDDEDPF